MTIAILEPDPPSLVVCACGSSVKFELSFDLNCSVCGDFKCADCLDWHDGKCERCYTDGK